MTDQERINAAMAEFQATCERYGVDQVADVDPALALAIFQPKLVQGVCSWLKWVIAVVPRPNWIPVEQKETPNA